MLAAPSRFVPPSGSGTYCRIEKERNEGFPKLVLEAWPARTLESRFKTVTLEDKVWEIGETFRSTASD